MTQQIESLRSAMKRTLLAHDDFLAAWRNWNRIDFEEFRTPENVALLLELVRRRIYPTNAFEILVRVDPDSAIDVLLSRYLANGVDPDTKFGGYTFELSSMLDDLQERLGATSLRRLIEHPQFKESLLRDSRVVEAFSAALDIPIEQFSRWRHQGSETAGPAA